MKTVLTIVGARPQFVKAAALSREIMQTDGLRELILHTGQHYDANMSQQFFEQLGIPEPYQVLTPSRNSSSAFIGESITQIGKTIQQVKPDVVLVYGDTYSTLAGAIAANSSGVLLAHVEAGLRSFNRAMPEEHNRVVTDHLSDMLFCTSGVAVDNLAKESITNSDQRHVSSVGDIMFDALNLFSDVSQSPKNFSPTRDFLLVTIHRPINVDCEENLRSIIESLSALSSEFDIVWPCHPRTYNRLKQLGLAENAHIKLLPPVSYLEMLYLLKHSTAVITDSGGLQKEAFFSGKFCFVVRDETEWVELVELGFSTLVKNGARLLCDHVHAATLSDLPNDALLKSPYGDGKTRKRIVNSINDYLMSVE